MRMNGCVVLCALCLSRFALAAPVSYPESTDGLVKLIDDTFSAIRVGDTDRARELVRSMILPEQQAWFRKTFGDDFGAAISIEYGRRTPSMEQELLGALEDRIRDGNTFVRVIKVESAEDENATGLQKTAIKNMRVKVPLYTVKFADRPGGTGFSLWSWVYERGSFRIVGKMDVFRNRPAPAPVEAPATQAIAAPTPVPAPIPTSVPVLTLAPTTSPTLVPATSETTVASGGDLAAPSADVLKKAFEELITAIQAGKDEQAASIVRSMMLGDSEKWFVSTFGDSLGRPMADQYLAELGAGMESELLQDIRAQIAKGRTNVIAYKIDGADDPKAEERQKQAMSRMVQKQPLYGVRLTEPGQVSGTHYRSFVFVDGKFRLVGKMSTGR
jgi:hypothetical protein